MGKTTEAFTVPEGSFECPVEALHVKYLGREVMAVNPQNGLRVIGKLESIKFGGKGEFFFNDEFHVSLRISGYKLKLPKGSELIFTDGSGSEQLP
jgi:hypothetical protein